MNPADRLSIVAKNLKEKRWWTAGGWISSVHPFPAENPEAITLHVSKKNWFNEESQGIHFESFLMIDPKKQKKSSVVLHLLHDPKIPGTSISRKVLAEHLVAAIYDEVSEWEGYIFRAGKFGVQPFTKVLDGSAPTFESELEFEIERLCKALGPAIDKSLKFVLRGERQK